MTQKFHQKGTMPKHSTPPDPMSSGAATLVSRVVKDRLERVIRDAEGARVVYAIVDLGPDLTSAIGRALAEMDSKDRPLEIAIHSSLAVGLPETLISDDVATRFRNRAKSGVVATIFSVPNGQIEEVLQSLGSVQRINEAWLCDVNKVDIWATKTLPDYPGEISNQLTKILTGIIRADILISAEMFAEFCISVQQTMEGPLGFPLVKAINHSLPYLRLPRNSMVDIDPNRLAESAGAQFRKLRDEIQPYLYLTTRKGELRPRSDMRLRLEILRKDGDLTVKHFEALKSLINDWGVTAGSWQCSQQKVAEISWTDVRKFFVERSSRPVGHIGKETIEYLDAEYPAILDDHEREMLDALRKSKDGSNVTYQGIFLRHRERIRTNSRLYKKWQDMVFDKPVEEFDDLIIGLIRLAEKAFRGKEHMSASALLIRLRGSEKRSFWRVKKNWHLCTYIRDRYRGLPEVLGPDVDLDFGRCWEPGILDGIGEDQKNLRGSDSAIFEFEAYALDKMDSDKATADRRRPGSQHKAQMTWKPNHLSFATALAEDLRRVYPAKCNDAFLVKSTVSAARNNRDGATMRASVQAVGSIIDSFGESSGSLVNTESGSSRRHRICVDGFWFSEFKTYAQGAVAYSDVESVDRLFREFRRQYSSAIRAMIDDEGDGLASPTLVAQFRSYGQLLAKLRAVARTDTLVCESWAPLLQIGTANVAGDLPTAIVAPWNPLRLFELATKAWQAASVIQRIMEGSSEGHGSVSDYVRDRIRALQETYYLDVGLIQRNSGYELLVETEACGGYSVLQAPLLQSGERLVEVPVKDAVERFGDIAAEYLRQRPHERANFSTVLLDSEAEALPVMVAKHFAREIDNEPYLRCELTVAHEDREKLRQIYERQNLRIGHAIESSLTSEAARIFMSRLRVGIAPLATLGTSGRSKRHDIVFLHDVIARYARVVWNEVGNAVQLDELREHCPSDTSKRKSQVQGSLTTSVYLTSPIQIECSQAYLDVLHDVIRGAASLSTKHYVPSQEVNLGSQQIKEKLDLAHRMAHWVVTYDRIADSRLISSTDRKLRVLRYYSSPRSVYNVIVSTEIQRDDLQERLQDDLQKILPDYSSEILHSVFLAVEKQATSLAGGILMRGRHWDNYARELIGVIVAQRELDRFLADQGDGRTAMFFLDEFKSWLDLGGEISDILAVNLQVSDKNRPIIHLVVAEAKCVNRAGLSVSRRRSWEQLEVTYAAIMNRFKRGESTMDPSIWRNRLADMLIEHMPPWGEQEKLGERSFDEWIEVIRAGRFNVEVSGHSILAVYNQAESAEDLELRLADPDRLPIDRRRLAQWTFGADCIKRTILGVMSEEAGSQLHLPKAWLVGQTGLSHQALEPQSTVEGDAYSDENPQGASRDAVQSDRVDRNREESSPKPISPVDPEPTPVPLPDVPSGWKPRVFAALLAMGNIEDERQGKVWLEDQVSQLRRALQAENAEARISIGRLTPNAGIVHIDGSSVSVSWLSRKQVDLLTRYGIDIVRITPEPGRISVALRRPNRKILHLVDAWRHRELQSTAPESNVAMVIGEREDDGSLFYLSLNGDFAGDERAAPHTLISGTTGSGKGILTSNLILDLCAFNDPRSIEVYLIDPKQGADYLWARELPHLRHGIVDRKDSALGLLRQLVHEMDERYNQITQDGSANIDQYNRKHPLADRIPRVVVFFDEVANWMQDDEFKHKIEGVINEIATKSRAAGMHLFMIYQRADNQVMTMQLRTNLGNKLILRLGDEGSSRIALGEKGAERLLGKGHIIAKLGNDQKIYGQVPFIGETEISTVANSIRDAWIESQP